VADPRWRDFGAGVLLARLETGVPERCENGVASLLSLSTLRFFTGGRLIALAIPFFLSVFGAGRFFVSVGCDAV
jgi:hypothetical protein